MQIRKPTQITLVTKYYRNAISCTCLGLLPNCHNENPNLKDRSRTLYKNLLCNPALTRSSQLIIPEAAVLQTTLKNASHLMNEVVDYLGNPPIVEASSVDELLRASALTWRNQLIIPWATETHTITNKNTNREAQHGSKSSTITPTCPISDFFVITYVSAWQLEYQLTNSICSIILLTTKNWQQQEFVQHPRFAEPAQLADKARDLNYFSGAVVRLIKNFTEHLSLLDQKTIKPTCPTSDLFMTTYVRACNLHTKS